MEGGSWQLGREQHTYQRTSHWIGRSMGAMALAVPPRSLGCVAFGCDQRWAMTILQLRPLTTHGPGSLIDDVRWSFHSLPKVGLVLVSMHNTLDCGTQTTHCWAWTSTADRGFPKKLASRAGSAASSSAHPPQFSLALSAWTSVGVMDE